MEILTALASPLLVVIIGIIYAERRLATIETDIRWMRLHIEQLEHSLNGAH